jgi:hypothetical protein
VNFGGQPFKFKPLADSTDDSAILNWNPMSYLTQNATLTDPANLKHLKDSTHSKAVDQTIGLPENCVFSLKEEDSNS